MMMRVRTVSTQMMMTGTSTMERRKRGRQQKNNQPENNQPKQKLKVRILASP
jgi:hypothetical protein